MTGKSISTGTLNLRFMQNARRNEELAQAEAASKVQIQDESFWEVSSAVREAWGIATGAQKDSDLAVVHEASYIPFLFPSASTSADATDQPKLRGRRTWNKHGKEVTEADTQPKPEDSSAGATEDASSTSSRSKPLRHLTSISGMGPPARGAKEGRESKKPTSRGAQTARDVIRESGRVGTDLRSSRTEPASMSSPSPILSDTRTFMKPAGVDEPSLNKGRRPPKTEEDGGIVYGTRSKEKTPALKRARTERAEVNMDSGDVRDEEGKSRKKKKNKAE